MSAEPAENAVAVVETMKERRLRTLELYTKRQLIHQKDGDPHIGPSSDSANRTFRTYRHYGHSDWVDRARVWKEAPGGGARTGGNLIGGKWTEHGSTWRGRETGAGAGEHTAAHAAYLRSRQRDREALEQVAQEKRTSVEDMKRYLDFEFTDIREQTVSVGIAVV